MSIGNQAYKRDQKVLQKRNEYFYDIRQISQKNRTCMQGFVFEADDWYFYEYAPGKERHVRQIHLHFGQEAGQQVKNLIKQYAAWRLGRVRPVTVRLELDTGLYHWKRYLHARKLTDPAQFDTDEMERFGRWLYMKGIKESARNRALHTVSRLITTGQRIGWQVTKEPLSGDVFRRESGAVFGQDELSISEKQPEPVIKAGKTLPIPKTVYEQILFHAINDEKDEITRAGIIIQSRTGLRISEVLSLKENCITTDGKGRQWLTYSLKKTTKAEPEQRRIPAELLVCETVERLRTATELLRKESGRKELFLVRNHGIRPVSQTNWNQGRLRNFLRRWNITDENGEIPELHSHRFRATYVSGQIAGGGQIEQIRCRFGHVSPEMTARYVHLQEEEILDALTPCMGTVGR